MRRRHLIIVAGAVMVAGAGVAYAASLGVTSKRLTVLSADAPTTTTSSSTTSSSTTTSSTTTTTAPSTTAPNVMTVLLANGGSTAGRAEKGDRVEITFNPSMNPDSFCAGWGPGYKIEGASQVQVTVKNGATVNGVSGNDSLVVQALGSAPCPNAFKFGTIDLGSPGYAIGGDLNFVAGGNDKSTAVWSPATGTTPSKLTINLGALGSSTGTRGTVAVTSVPTPLVATFSPSTDLRDVNGKQPTGVGVSAATVQF